MPMHPVGVMVARRLTQKSKVGTVLKAVMVAVSVVIILVVVVGAISLKTLLTSDLDNNDAVQAAQRADYRDIHVLRRSMVLVANFGCARGDTTRFDMVGTDAQGKRVEFHICYNADKFATIHP